MGIVDTDFIFDEDVGEGGTSDGDEGATTDGTFRGRDVTNQGENQERRSTNELGATRSTMDEVERESTGAHGVDIAGEGSGGSTFTEKFTTFFLTNVEGEIEEADSLVTLAELGTGDSQ